MSKHLIDQGHTGASGRTSHYSRLERMQSGEAAHPSIKLLDRRRRKGRTDATKVKQFLRIERGRLA